MIAVSLHFLYVRRKNRTDLRKTPRYQCESPCQLNLKRSIIGEFRAVIVAYDPTKFRADYLVGSEDGRTFSQLRASPAATRVWIRVSISASRYETNTAICGSHEYCIDGLLYRFGDRVAGQKLKLKHQSTRGLPRNGGEAQRTATTRQKSSQSSCRTSLLLV